MMGEDIIGLIIKVVSLLVKRGTVLRVLLCYIVPLNCTL